MDAYKNIPSQVLNQALLVQDACNLGAIVHGFSRIIRILQEQSHKENLGTQWINEHPAVKIICDKLVDLARVRSLDDFSKAYNIIKNQIEKGE